MKTMCVKFTLGAIVVAAALAFAGGIAAAAPANNAAHVANGIASNHAAGATDISARRRHLRRYNYVRPYPYVYPPTYGYAYPPSYGYYRPRPYYYRPYYNPGPFFSFGFGPRRFW